MTKFDKIYVKFVVNFMFAIGGAMFVGHSIYDMFKLTIIFISFIYMIEHFAKMIVNEYNDVMYDPYQEHRKEYEYFKR